MGYRDRVDGEHGSRNMVVGIGRFSRWPVKDDRAIFDDGSGVIIRDWAALRYDVYREISRWTPFKFLGSMAVIGS